MPFGQPLLLAFLAGTAQTPPSPPPPPAPPATQGLPQAQPVTPTAPSSPAQAQPAPAEEIEEETEDEEEDAEIVVTGRRPLGAVIGDIPPEITLNPRDIRSYGASNLAELLDALSPQTRSGRGRGEGGPVVLLNGRRISGFGEIRDMPPEAIIRIDILPEEVALKYGYRADQRVVNFVLRPRFRAITGESEYGLATQGGRSDYEMEANILQVGEAGRWSLNANHRHSAPLFESERDVLGEPDPFRTLLPETDQYALNGTVNRNILDDVSATLNARFDLNESVSGLGLAEAEQRPLRRNSDRWNGHLGASLNGTLDPWRWTVTGNYDRSRSLTLTDVEREGAASIARDRAESVNQTANVELVANGPLFHLPAGNVSTSVRTGFELRDFTSGTIRGGIEQSRNLSRDRGSGQINLDFPIASRRNDFLGAIGSLSANFNAELEQLSDFGTLRTVGYGLNWSPITQINLIASVTDEDGAPSVQQLGDPVVLTPNVRVFDFVRGETVDIARIEGGNPELTADNRRVFKLGLNLRPLSEIDLSLSANYTKTRTVNLIASFPTATPEIEAAFPERFVRDDAGRLLRIDTRPVNFARSDREDMRWGINFSKALGPAGPPGGAGGRGERRFARGGGGAAGAEAQTGQRPGGATPPGAAAQGEARGPGARGPGGFGRGPGGFGGFGGGGRGGRLQFSLYHSWRLEDSTLIRPGVPELDFLDGSAFGGRGGRPRHEIEFQAGIFKNGLGARVNANWQSSTFVRGGADRTAAASSDLFFSDFATVNLRLFANLGQQRSLVRGNPWLRGTRISVSVDNLFDARPGVRDAAGATPISYQPAFLDPLGRTVRISLRKLFF